MPQLSIKANFMAAEDWTPLGQAVPSLHDLTVKTGVDLKVTSGIVIEVKDATIDIKLDGGGDVEVT